MEYVNCPGCDTDSSEPWGSENGYSAGRCRNCGLIYVNPRPTASEITGAQRLGMHATDRGVLTTAPGRSAGKVRAMRARIARLFAAEIARGKPIRWLDIGAGYGETVEAAISVLPQGSVVTGIEPNLTKVAEAQKLGLAIAAIDLSDLSGPYNVVSLINVFSHVPNFTEFGAKIIDVMAEDGSLLIETGDFGSIRRWEFPDRLYFPDHLIFAGVDQMARILRKLELEIVSEERASAGGMTFMVKSVLKSLLDRRFGMFFHGSKFRRVTYKIRKQEKNRSPDVQRLSN